MFVDYARWYLCASWVLLVLLTFLAAAGAASAGSVLLLAVGAIVPPLIMLALWQDGSPLTIAEALHAVDKQS